MTLNPTFANDVSSIARIEAVKQILEVVCRSTGMGFSAVARVTETHWVACAVRDEIEFGLKPGSELQIETTICNEIRQSGQLVVIDHVTQDPLFCGHPTPQKYGFESYISAPIRLSDGRFFGTLCAIDPRPARLNTPEVIGMFQLFAALIGQHLDTQERLAANETALLGEREAAKLREQFMAVLGHDLRNPLAAVDAGVEVMRSLPGNEENARILDMLKRSTTRMSELIDNVLDLARGRLGGGLSLNCVFDDHLEVALQQVVSELQATSPTRTIHCEFSIDRAIFCNSARLAQMLSNLLANALSHSTPGTPIRVRAQSLETNFELSVINAGKGIDPHIREQLFEPFVRGAVRSGQEGLGLGLYIAAEIARAHAGSLEVTAAEGEICFTFTMPVNAGTL